MSTVRDRFWLWTHAAGSHDTGYGISGTSRMTPVEGAFYMNIPNVILVRYIGKPELPFHQYAVPFRPLKQVVWSIVGAGGATDDAEREAVFELADRFPNITGVMMDDFFRKSDDGESGSLSVNQLRDVRKRLVVGGRTLDLWVVLYANQFDLPGLAEHLALCDKVSFWTWTADKLADLERNFAKAEELAPKCGKVLGCYMYDYGRRQPMPVDLMRNQCETGLRWLREGRIEGMIFLASCICDLDLEAVEWTRQWIAEVGDEEIG